VPTSECASIVVGRGEDVCEGGLGGRVRKRDLRKEGRKEWMRKGEEGATLTVKYIVFDCTISEVRPRQLCPDLGISAEQNLRGAWKS
jgi:hypothetical protein